jgi:Protein of unknown function (DUF1592)/Protein of unknown function (DUF1588)/Protein of unknown function (DUF1587)
MGAAACARAPAARAPSVDPAKVGQLLPARVRRLSSFEYERTVHALFGVDQPIASRLPPDVRKDGYTVNGDQGMPATWAAQLGTVARDVAHRVTEAPGTELARCLRARRTNPKEDGTCESWVTGLRRRAFRRPLDPAERSRLLGAFREDGAEGVIVLILQSPSLLYVTELGQGGRSGDVVTLGPYEIASSLSYMLRGAPPDEPLLVAAEAKTLASADAREAEARRLLAMPDTRHHFRRFVLEWLEVDELEQSAKSTQLFPHYEELRSQMLAETTAFVDEVMVYGGGSLRNLLDAGFASVDPSMARFYGLKTWGARASLASTPRRGLLQQASFLAAHAHEDETSPVKRGDFVMRKLLCKPVPRPQELGIEVVMPPPSTTRSTRERIAAHTTDKACRACHETLDAIGYTFEGFDAMGGARQKENGKTIDTSARVRVLGAERAFANSAELTRWLATEPAVSECFARQAFRYFSAGGDATAEEGFLETRRSLPEATRADLFETLIAYIRSDAFVLRRMATP